MTIYTVPFFKEHSLITNPEVITVLVIKKKFVEQLPQKIFILGSLRENLHSWPFGSSEVEILGVCDGFRVIVRNPEDGKLAWIQATDYVNYVKSKMSELSAQEKWDAAVDLVDKIPQIFID